MPKTQMLLWYDTQSTFPVGCCWRINYIDHGMNCSVAWSIISEAMKVALMIKRDLKIEDLMLVDTIEERYYHIVDELDAVQYILKFS